MKVLIVFNHPAPYKVRIFNELAKYVDLTVIFERSKAKDRPDDFYSCNDYHFKHITFYDGYIGREGSISSNTKKYIQKHHQEFDHIVMNGYSHLSEILAIKYMAKYNISFSLMINGGIIRSKEAFFKRNFKKGLVEKASFYISPSQKSNEYLEYYGAKKERIFNYPYSNFSIDEITKNSNIDIKAVREEYGLPIDEKIFINPAQFIDRKNNLFLLEIFKVRKEHLLLVGSGEEKQKYIDYITKNDMKNVTILHFMKKEDLFILMKACDAFISLAKEDIFGHTTLEALANGLPVISSDKVISSLEYVKNGYNGYIVSLDNKEEINKAINNIFNIKKENTFESVKNNTFEACGKEIYKILESQGKKDE